MTNPVVIGIGGQKHSGKDTFASMLFYINHVGPAAATFNTWFEYYQIGFTSNKQMTTHFAEPLKDACSVMFHIERKLFDDLNYKDILNILNNPFSKKLVD